MTDKPTPKEIDDLVYELRQAGKDDTYSLASAVLAKWGSPAPVGAEPVALLVRKNSWRDGQWEVAPPNSPSYGLAWADQRVYVYTTPQPTQVQPIAQAAEPVANVEVRSSKNGTALTLSPDFGAFSLPEGLHKLYPAPQPVAREQLTPEQIQDLLLCGNPTDEEMRLIRIGWDAAHGGKGGQHGTK